MAEGGNKDDTVFGVSKADWLKLDRGSQTKVFNRFMRNIQAKERKRKRGNATRSLTELRQIAESRGLYLYSPKNECYGYLVAKGIPEPYPYTLCRNTPGPFDATAVDPSLIGVTLDKIEDYLCDEGQLGLQQECPGRR